MAVQTKEDFRDRLSNVDEQGKRRWIYALQPPRRILYKIRNYFSYLYFAIFFGMPFITLHGEPFFMINFPAGRFIIFGKIFWPSDFFIFAVAMLIMIIVIALFTRAYGRIFCGWMCPQTFFLEMMYRKIEWWIEGTPAQQRKLERPENSTERIRKKTIKHVVFFLLSFLIANTFLAYIIGLKELITTIQQPIKENWVLLSSLLAFTAIFYSVFAFVREIVCTTICPYGRLQSVLVDEKTMQVSYDYGRGEPRGKLKRNAATRELGDCIDCKMCVNVCPTGIDIRDGYQMECVGCTACIDACNDVMEKVQLPLGLIRYASEQEIKTGVKQGFDKRMKVYSGALVVLSLLLGTLIYFQRSIDTTIVRASGQMYQELPNHQLGNLYTAKVLNKTRDSFEVSLALKDMEGSIQLVSNKELHIKPETINQITFFIKTDEANIVKRNTEVAVEIYKEGDKLQTVKTSFLGPFK